MPAEYRVTRQEFTADSVELPTDWQENESWADTRHGLVELAKVVIGDENVRNALFDVNDDQRTIVLHYALRDGKTVRLETAEVEA